MRAPSLALTLALTLVLVLSACGTERGRDPSATALLGPSSATGTIASTGASLYRRGTHLLLIGGKPRLFLESKTVDLHAYEGISAVVSGDIRVNTDPRFLPVMQVQELTEVTGEGTASFQPYDIPALGLSFEAPRSWVSVLAGGRLSFRRSLDDVSAEPFLTVERTAGGALPDGLPLRIGGKNGVRVVEGDHHRVFVRSGDKSLVVFVLTLQHDDPSLRDAFYTLLQTVRFREGAGGSASSASSPSENSPLIHCGGPAGVLCPKGQYCAVQELDTGIGVCRKITS